MDGSNPEGREVLTLRCPASCRKNTSLGLPFCTCGLRYFGNKCIERMTEKKEFVSFTILRTDKWNKQTSQHSGSGGHDVRSSHQEVWIAYAMITPSGPLLRLPNDRPPNQQYMSIPSALWRTRYKVVSKRSERGPPSASPKYERTLVCPQTCFPKTCTAEGIPVSLGPEKFVRQKKT